MEELLKIQDLFVNFYTYRGVVKALNGIRLNIRKSESIGLVGETGCGKSVTARSIVKLIDRPGVIESGHVFFEGKDLLALSEAELRKFRGKQISFIFQEPKKALDPTSKVGHQLIEAIQKAQPVSEQSSKDIGSDILHQVGLADPHRIMNSYSFELSGGMAQRVMIGMAICGKPKLIIADEPTSALDVSIQAQIIRLIGNLTTQYGSSLLLITHDLGLAAENCDRIAVMYAGNIVEVGAVEKVFSQPGHPYTVGLLKALPSLEAERLFSIPGTVPDLICPPPGCHFSPRCGGRTDQCSKESPPFKEISEGHGVACFCP